MIVYLDLDGVFADFKSHFQKVVGFAYEVNPKRAWSILEKEDHLFSKLEPLPDAIDMFNRIYWHFDKVKILTALPIITGKLTTAKEDKIEWVHKYLAKDIEVICADGWEGKSQYAKPGDVLVDDMVRNIGAWRLAGGTGILHKNCRNTIFQMAGLLDSVM